MILPGSAAKAHGRLSGGVNWLACMRGSPPSCKANQVQTKRKAKFPGNSVASPLACKPTANQVQTRCRESDVR
jgi:hypothetical protein